MKSPNPNENKNSGGQKFKNRQPGEKRNRLKADSSQSNSNPSKGFDSKPSKPREPRRNSEGFDSNRTSGFSSSRNENRTPRAGSDHRFNGRGDSDRGGFEKKERGFSDRNSADRGFNSKSGTNRSGSDRNESNRGGSSRGGSWGGENKTSGSREGSRKSTGSWGGSKRPSGGWGEGDRGSSPRGDRNSGGGRGFNGRGDSDRGGFDKNDRGFNSRNDSKPSRFGKERGSYSGSTGRSFNKPEFGGKREFEGKSDRGFGKSKTAKKKDNFQETPKGYKGSRRTFGKVQQQQEQSLLAGEDLVRLNRYIANSGICSRREADELISQGLVKVNGEVVTELGTKVRPHDSVKVEDRKVTPEKPVYILLNKPKGYITSTSDPDGRQTVLDLIDLPGKERIYPVGRLDRNTTGVLLLTNDGELSQKLMHPSFEIKKIYRATLDKKPTKEHMLAWVEGVELEDGWMTFEQIGWVEEGDENVLGVEIKSGRNRIVRRMFEHFGYDVTSLDRAMLGEFDKLKLGRGKWRFLTEKEMRYIERIKRMH